MPTGAVEFLFLHFRAHAAAGAKAAQLLVAATGRVFLSPVRVVEVIVIKIVVPMAMIMPIATPEATARATTAASRAPA